MIDDIATVYQIPLFLAGGAVIAAVLGWDTGREWSRFKAAMCCAQEILLAAAVFTFVGATIEDRRLEILMQERASSLVIPLPECPRGHDCIYEPGKGVTVL